MESLRKYYFHFSMAGILFAARACEPSRTVVHEQPITSSQQEHSPAHYLQCITSKGDEVPVGTSVTRPVGVDYCANVVAHENKAGKTDIIFSSMDWNGAKICLSHNIDSNKNEIVSFGNYCPSEDSSE